MAKENLIFFLLPDSAPFAADQLYVSVYKRTKDKSVSKFAAFLAPSRETSTSSEVRLRSLFPGLDIGKNRLGNRMAFSVPGGSRPRCFPTPGERRSLGQAVQCSAFAGSRQSVPSQAAGSQSAFERGASCRCFCAFPLLQIYSSIARIQEKKLIDFVPWGLASIQVRGAPLLHGFASASVKPLSFLCQPAKQRPWPCPWSVSCWSLAGHYGALPLDHIGSLGGRSVVR